MAYITLLKITYTIKMTSNVYVHIYDVEYTNVGCNNVESNYVDNNYVESIIST